MDFHAAKDRVRCVVADALIRYGAGRGDITVARERGGKPYIPDMPDFFFNLSHSGRWAAICWGGTPVGIDVEKIRMDAAKEALARRYFTKGEQDLIFSAQGESRAREFFRIWTAKESYLKYLGVGLTRPLNSFCVVPDGTPLDVRFTSTFLEDHCLTLCAQEEAGPITFLEPASLIRREN